MCIPYILQVVMFKLFILQLHESKGPMAELEKKLKTDLSADEGKFNQITADIFKDIEERKNIIIDRQGKKFNSLSRSEDDDVLSVHSGR